MLYHKTYELGPDHEWVVFVHGAGGSSSVWYKQIREFQEHFNVLLLDLRGHGKSAQPETVGRKERYSFESVSRDVVDVLDHLGIEQAHFVGISLGSILIRTIYEIAPSRVKSMILGGAITRLNLRSRFLIRAGNLLKRWVPFMWLYKLFAWIIMPRDNHKESRLLFVREAQRLARREFLRWFRLTAEIRPILDRFEEEETEAPILYLMGEEDHLFLPPVRRLANKHQNALLKVVEDSGHVVNVDRADIFNETAIAFIYRIAGTPLRLQPA